MRCCVLQPKSVLTDLMHLNHNRSNRNNRSLKRHWDEIRQQPEYFSVSPLSPFVNLNTGIQIYTTQALLRRFETQSMHILLPLPIPVKLKQYS